MLEGRDARGQPVAAEEYLCRDPQERLFYKGRWYEGLYLHAGASADDREQLQAFPGRGRSLGRPGATAGAAGVRRCRWRAGFRRCRR